MHSHRTFRLELTKADSIRDHRVGTSCGRGEPSAGKDWRYSPPPAAAKGEQAAAGQEVAAAAAEPAGQEEPAAEPAGQEEPAAKGEQAAEPEPAPAAKVEQAAQPAPAPAGMMQTLGEIIVNAALAPVLTVE